MRGGHRGSCCRRGGWAGVGGWAGAGLPRPWAASQASLPRSSPSDADALALCGVFAAEGLSPSEAGGDAVGTCGCAQAVIAPVALTHPTEVARQAAILPGIEGARTVGQGQRCCQQQAGCCETRHESVVEKDKELEWMRTRRDAARKGR